MLDLIYKRFLTGVLMLLVVRKIHITHPFPRTFMTQRRKKITPNKSTIRGCWGGYLTQWSMLITSRRSSGKWSIWVAPKCFGHKTILWNFLLFKSKTGHGWMPIQLWAKVYDRKPIFKFQSYKMFCLDLFYEIWNIQF